jgi:homoserine kinase
MQTIKISNFTAYKQSVIVTMEDEPRVRNKSVLVKVPATVGNFGGAENCAALALDAALNVKVTPRRDGRVGVRYFGENGERVPRDRTNLAVRAMEAALHLAGREFWGADFEIYSSVPVAVGLGSSTAAILAGLIAADSVYSLDLDEKTILDLASVYEDRTDNLQAAWLGGFIFCADEGGWMTARRALVPANFSFSVVAPDAPLEARGMEPAARGTLRNGAHFSKRASALAAYFARPGRGSLPDLGAPLPPTCQKRVPGIDDALRVQGEGVLAIFVCGSGPAVGILTENNPQRAIHAVRDSFAKAGVKTSFGIFRPANAGARDWNAVRAEIVMPIAPPAKAVTEALPH